MRQARWERSAFHADRTQGLGVAAPGPASNHAALRDYDGRMIAPTFRSACAGNSVPKCPPTGFSKAHNPKSPIGLLSAVRMLLGEWTVGLAVLLFLLWFGFLLFAPNRGSSS